MLTLESTVPNYPYPSGFPQIQSPADDTWRNIGLHLAAGAGIAAGALYLGKQDIRDKGGLRPWLREQRQKFAERRARYKDIMKARKEAAIEKLKQRREEWENLYAKKKTMNPFHGGHMNFRPLRALHKWLEKPTLPFYDLGVRGNLKALPKGVLRGAVSSIPVIGGIWPMVDLAFAATSDHPLRSYASAVATQTLAPIGFRLGASTGALLGKVTMLPRTMAGAGGIFGGMIFGAVGAFGMEIGDMIAGIGKAHRYSSFKNNYEDSVGAATMRQASLMAIRNSELNNRNFILGNEASYYLGM